jgi:hypothetical protein
MFQGVLRLAGITYIANAFVHQATEKDFH